MTTQDYRNGHMGLPWPRRVFQVNEFGTGGLEPAGPYAGEGGGYYSDYSDLIQRLSDFRPFHGAQDARKHALTVFVWDTARLVGFRKTPSGLEIGVEGDDMSGLFVTGKTTSTDAVPRRVAKRAALVALVSVGRRQLRRSRGSGGFCSPPITPNYRLGTVRPGESQTFSGRIGAS